MVSHYGTEHYCPLSLVRVYGTSMVEDEEEEIVGDEMISPSQVEETITYNKKLTRRLDKLEKNYESLHLSLQELKLQVKI